jgi:dienelactone hydrolase
MLRKQMAAIALLLMIASPPACADDRLVDGVPLPSDATVAAPAPGTPLQRHWSGVWIGAWEGALKHILLVESIDENGAARVIYAVDENASIGVRRIWSRYGATASERTLIVAGTGFSATYEAADDGRLKATYKRGGSISHATMTRTDLAALTKPNAVIDWTAGKSELVQTDLIEDGKPVWLEVVIFKPAGTGPFPLAVINHGSTGGGRIPELFGRTWFNAGLAEFLNARGWMVAFPQRRGRGNSDGLYDEGFAANRKLGYICDTDISLRGADRALGDIDAAITALRRRPDVARGPILIGGQSRGGVLAVAYAGLHPAQIAGVVNFVGGWLGERCPSSSTVNQTLFGRGARYGRPTIWLYGRGDQFYSIAHSRENFAAFEKAGGRGTFLDFDFPDGQGHNLIRHPDLWSGPVDDYLHSLDATEKRSPASQ